ncbi:tetratricopeptide repeat protein [Stenotrophomonas maltophilia]|uniref:tetratricopeptide repeat protein n=1 Tax=Stenotrophomonas TaxID=40323 RepID=UPI0012DAFAF0|nr:MULTISPECIES: tetratricopeptide repeat protein [Stenotrophomonas maltophilia group]MBA0225839.1 tetratricopeptide repeat protein [Stenotrophomonas maltophilia]MBA0366732.1 tetratricopeptide repeat protein [Stenotrophomonas maltophilia]MBA0404869.1 tetratricopeptide repeat protein [Stenotrophomonas maltophilia]MCF3525399.1 tetratricopeptide repeat protein [Stenotrophomonas maltophilia]MCF3554569.1 tetratricopeptide repeat protein [Stenotrophomonas maltophilia]
MSMDIRSAKLLLESGDLDGARKQLLEIVERDPSSERAWLLLVGLGFRTNDANLSLQALRQLEKTRPRDAFVVSGLVDCLIQLERYGEAKEVIRAFSDAAVPGIPAHDTVLQEHRRALQFINDRLEAIDRSSGSP